MTDPKQIFIEKSFDSAEEFLDFLSPTKDSLGRGDWVFRGHENASWAPLPSLLRSPRVDIIDKMYKSFYQVFTKRELGRSWLNFEDADAHMETQITKYLENKLLRDFTDKANRVGLPVPEIEKILNQPRGDFPNFPD